MVKVAHEGLVQDWPAVLAVAFSLFPMCSLWPWMERRPFTWLLMAVAAEAWEVAPGRELLTAALSALADVHPWLLLSGSAAIGGLAESAPLSLLLLGVWLMRLLSGRHQPAEAALREVSEAFQAVIQTSPLAIVAVDREGKVSVWNPAAERLYGWSAAEALGHPLPIIPEDQRQEFEALLAGEFGGEMRAGLELRRLRKDGSLLDVSLWTAPLRNAQGEVIGLLGFFADITERKRAEEERERLLARERAARAEAEAAFRISHAIQAFTDLAIGQVPLDELLRELLGRVCTVMGSDAATVLLLSEDGQYLEARASDGLEEEVAARVKIPLGRGIAGTVAAQQRPVMVEDTSSAEILSPFLRERVRSLAAAPLLVEGKSVGVIYVGTFSPRRFAEEDVRLLEVVAYATASAIDRARLFEQVRAGRERLRLLSQRLIEAQETERRHIARELHDEIGQAFTAIKLSLQAAQGVAQAPALAAQLEESIQMVAQAQQRVRDLSLDLRPSLLDDLGLVAALRWYLDRQAQRLGWIAQFAADPPNIKLPVEIETTCFRVAQEAVTNIARHARAGRVWIELRQGTAELQLTIRDDGVGFDPRAAMERAAQGQSLGLLSMQERALLAGGEVEIASEPGRGTGVRARFPLTSS
jgi:PAS domain S-box-containing protein